MVNYYGYMFTRKSGYHGKYTRYFKNNKHFNAIIKIFYHIDRRSCERKRIADYSAITLFCVNLQVVRTI